MDDPESELARARRRLAQAEWHYRSVRGGLDSAGEMALGAEVERAEAEIRRLTGEEEEGTSLLGEPPRVSVLMPTFRQAEFVQRALESLLAQELTEWELIIVDDGSTDDTVAVITPYLADERIRLVRFSANRGLGFALNAGLARARASFIAYLPSDDYYCRNHLASLSDYLDGAPEAVLAYSGIKCEIRVPGKGVVLDGTSEGQITGYPLQLVQVMHRRTGDRWMEREELTTDDLDRMFWSKLDAHGRRGGTGVISCEWVHHPGQRHKIIQEPLGGINPYRSHYGVKEPLRFHSTRGNPTDESEHYRRFRERPNVPPAPDGLRILLVGELAFNPERVLALEERGHTLYGLWTDAGHWFNTVGPLPFGHVRDVPRENWREALQDLQPDLIYALLNWEAVPFAHEVLTEVAGRIPFVWHLKEGPFDCIANGTWRQLLDLHTRTDGQIYSSPEARDWFLSAAPGTAASCSLVLDGDLPKQDWFVGKRSPRLSEADGEIHTVVPGGPIGLSPTLVGELARRGIHLHFYGAFHQGLFSNWVEEAREAAGDKLHVHPHVDQGRWVSELSKYDGGWLHLNRSRNDGDVRRADWGDLNYPARIPTLAAAGVPFIQLDNSGAVVAMQSLIRERDIGLFLRDPDQLAQELRDEVRMAELRANLWRQRMEFTFDYHAERLVEFFRSVIGTARSHA